MTNNQMYVHTAINGRHKAVADPTEKEVLKRTVEKWAKNDSQYPFKTWVLFGTHEDKLTL